MEVKDALSKILEQIDLANYEEEVATITNALAETPESGGDWKQKYIELEKKYKQRFVSMLDNNYTEEKDVEKEEETGIELDELDFDGSTE